MNTKYFKQKVEDILEIFMIKNVFYGSVFKHA